MVLEVTSTIKGSNKVRSLYFTIPPSMAADSQFPFKAEDEIKLIVRKDHIDIYPANTNKKSYL